MKELAILLAKALPMDMLLEKMQEALTEYKIIQSVENKNSMLFYCQLMMIRLSTEDRDTMEVVKEMVAAEKILEQFKEKHLTS
jgi:hypothetical protein